MVSLLFFLSFSDWRCVLNELFLTGKGGDEALFIMKNKKVYALGTNSNGCLGLNCTGRKLHPEEVTQLSEKNVKTFAYGSSPHVLALTDNGEVYYMLYTILERYNIRENQCWCFYTIVMYFM